MLDWKQGRGKLHLQSLWMRNLSSMQVQHVSCERLIRTPRTRCPEGVSTDSMSLLQHAHAIYDRVYRL